MKPYACFKKCCVSHFNLEIERDTVMHFKTTRVPGIAKKYADKLNFELQKSLKCLFNKPSNLNYGENPKNDMKWASESSLHLHKRYA